MSLAPIKKEEYRPLIAKMCEQAKAKVVVEIGVYAGALSHLLAETSSLEHLYIVDPWIWEKFGHRHMDKIARKVQRWADSTSNVHVLRMGSLAAVEEFEDGSIDFIHIDQRHGYQRIKSDIRAWWKKLRIGGLISGDNYEHPPLAKGVDELLPERQLSGMGKLRGVTAWRIWSVVKTEEKTFA